MLNANFFFLHTRASISTSEVTQMRKSSSAYGTFYKQAEGWCIYLFPVGHEISEKSQSVEERKRKYRKVLIRGDLLKPNDGR